MTRMTQMKYDRKGMSTVSSLSLLLVIAANELIRAIRG